MGGEIILSLSLLFLLTSNADSACNPGWTSYGDNCYIIALHKMDIRMARKYCQEFGAELAHSELNSTDYFRDFLNFEVQEEYWITEDIHSTDPSGTAQSCFYYYTSDYNNASSVTNFTTGQIQYDNCDAEKYFICEAQQLNLEFYCPQGWLMFGSTCYKTMKHPATYNGSSSFCSIQRGQLAVLDDVDKEHNALAVIAGHDLAFMVGATRENGVLNWSNSKPFQPNCDVCSHVQSNADCLGIQSSSIHPTSFEWISLNCSDLNAFLCEMSPLRSKERTTTVTVTTTSTTTRQPTTAGTTIAPLVCPVGYNWKPHLSSGFCFWETTYETDKLNWHQARKFCQAYGGDLATYDDAYQEELALGSAKGHYRGIWFGLKRNQNDSFTWVDGSPLDSFTNWDYSEPKLRSKSNYCVMHGATNSKWQLDYCGVRRWFICKAPRVQKSILPNTNIFKNTPCNFSDASYWDKWFSYKDHCYLVRETSSYSWDMAFNFCQDNGAHLASVHSFEETDFILTLITTSSTIDYWIGLSSRGPGTQYSWSDDSPLEFIYWGDDRNPDNVPYMNSCVKFDRQRGFWKVAHCNRFYGVICERRVNSSITLSTTKRTNLPGNCQKGWYLFGNQCYKVYGEKLLEKQNWTTALANCEEEEAKLTSIHNPLESDFLSDLMLSIGKDTWIGLMAEINQGAIHQWSDNTVLDYTNWGSGSPSSASSSMACVALTYSTYSMGKWTHHSCSSVKSYICQKPKNPHLTKPSEDLFSCNNITGWSKLGHSCFGFFEEKMTWLAAQSKCREFDANLLQFESSATGIFLRKRITKKRELYWTGIRETTRNNYGLVNGQRLKYTNWHMSQPLRASSFMDNCVAMNSDAKWVVRGCHESHAFVCEWTSYDPKEAVLEEEYSCPNASTWEDIGGNSCYYFQTYLRLSWNDAMFYCFRHGGYLATFHSSKEISLVRNRLIGNIPYIHIGLGRRKDGSFAWVDNSPVDFTEWDPDLVTSLDSKMNTKYCAQLSVNTGYWRTIDCDDYNSYFICSIAKIRNSEALSLNATKEQPVVSSKLEIGGVFGIIICLLVVSAIIGVTAYYLCPSTRMRVRLMESH